MYIRNNKNPVEFYKPCINEKKKKKCTSREIMGGPKNKTEKLAAKTGVANFGSELTPGVYFASLRSLEQSSAAIKLVKQ